MNSRMKRTLAPLVERWTSETQDPEGDVTLVLGEACGVAVLMSPRAQDWPDISGLEPFAARNVIICGQDCFRAFVIGETELDQERMIHKLYGFLSQTTGRPVDPLLDHPGTAGLN